MEDSKFLDWLVTIRVDGRIVERRPFLARTVITAKAFADMRANVFIKHMPSCQVSWEFCRNTGKVKL